MNNISVIGAGYVGLSIATLLSVKNNVVLLDVVEDKVNKVNNRISPIKDEYIEKYFSEKDLLLTATTDEKLAYTFSNTIFICVPTNYDESKNYFDTSLVDSCIEKVSEYNPGARIIIKSTIPIGYVDSAKKRLKYGNIFFSPEFLREGHALYDNLYPSRIIVGCNLESQYDDAKEISEILSKASLKDSVDIKIIPTKEAECIKLFSNTYLAMRVAYFNELDSFCKSKGLNSKDIIDGMCYDPRICNFYNNPSFGYGGYCLPKDTKQLLRNFDEIKNSDLIHAIVYSNVSRKKFIADDIKNTIGNGKTVGVYKLAMKSGSDNFRASAIFDIINQLREDGFDIIIYEPTVLSEKYMDYKIVNDFNKFINVSDIILANRIDDNLKFIKNKVYTRDIYNNN